MKNKLVVEYSVDQGCFHVDDMAGVLGMNLRAAAQGQDSGFVPVAIVDSYDEVEAAVRRVRGMLAGNGRAEGELP